ncbi:MAG: DUF6588 family protein [Bacteroidota bacterium]
MRNPILIAALASMVSVAHGQIIQSTRFVKGSISDGEKILMAYLQPLERSFNAIGGSGFVDSRGSFKNKKSVYSIGVQFVGAFSPVSERTYDINDLGLSEFEVSNSGNTVAQTFAGNSNTVELVTSTSYKTLTTSFPFYASKPLLKLNSPEGTGNALLGLGFLSASVYSGGAEIGLRFMPPLRVPETGAVVYSAGGYLRVEFNALVKSMQSFPFTVAALIGVQYTRLSLDPELAPESSRTEISLQPDNGPYDTQKFFVSSRAIPVELFIQKRLKSFVVYAGTGFIFSKSHAALEGNIPLYQTDPSDTFSVIIEDIENPVSYARKSNTAQFNFGLMYFLNSFGMNVGYSISKYQSFFLGCNVSI